MKDSVKFKTFDLLEGIKNGQVKCPKCGATDISRADESSDLRCNFCQTQFDFKSSLHGVDDDSADIENLKGVSVSRGAQDIDSNAEDIVTIKCESCGAEVVINSSESLEARCHWCRNYLSIRNVIPNGAVPDLVLPFQHNKQKARSSLETYMAQYKYFAHPRFKKQFNSENIFAVYMPYMLVDIHAHSVLEGKGESTIRKISSENPQAHKREIAVYRLKRDFHLELDDLPIESKRDRLAQKGTSHVINAVLPFDTKRAVKWNPTLLKGVRSEKRDMNVEGLTQNVFKQLYDIGFKESLNMIPQYDRGVRWQSHKQEVIGEKWVSIYLPVWLYTYKSWPWGKTYYTAMNARTGETVGTVPLHYLKLLFICSLFIIIPGLLAYYMHFEIAAVAMILAPWIFISTYRDYHKSGVKHDHLSSTRCVVTKLQQEDERLKTEVVTHAFTMKDANAYPPKQRQR